MQYCVYKFGNNNIIQVEKVYIHYIDYNNKTQNECSHQISKNNFAKIKKKQILFSFVSTDTVRELNKRYFHDIKVYGSASFSYSVSRNQQN